METDPSRIQRARDEIRNLDLPGTPSVGNSRILKECGFPEWCGTRKVIGIGIRHGDPQHGEKRSDDHISMFEVEANLADFETEGWDVEPETDFVGDRYETTCPECNGDRGIYRYNAYHFISGSEVVICADCEEQLHREEWG